MTLRRVLYLVLVAAVAGVAGLSGAVVGGAAVYRTLQARPPAAQQPMPAVSSNPGQSFTLNMTDMQTTITQAVQKVGPAVVTVVGTIPGQTTFFGQTADQDSQRQRFLHLGPGLCRHQQSRGRGNELRTRDPLKRCRAAGDHRRGGPIQRHRCAEEHRPGAGGRHSRQLRRASARRVRDCDRLASGRLQEHRHGGRRQRHRSHHRFGSGLRDRRPHPDRRRHQSGQLRWAAGRSGGRGHRHQHADRARKRRRRRRRIGLRHPDRHSSAVASQIIQKGYVAHPFLGITYQPISPSIARPTTCRSSGAST